MAVAIFELQGNAAPVLATALADEGIASFAVSSNAAASSDTALILVGSHPVDALGLIRTLRIDRPLLLQMVVTDRDDPETRLAAYEAGADDCVSRPFHLRELAAKLRSLRRRRRFGSIVPLIDGADAVVDQIALEVRANGQARPLTKREVDLLVLLANADGGLLGRDEALRRAFGDAPGLTKNLVDVYAGRLRRKLRQIGAGVAVEAVRGQGLRLVARPSASERSSSS